MFETIDELLKQIRLGENSSLELKDLRYIGDHVNAPNRNSIAEDLSINKLSFSRRKKGAHRASLLHLIF